MTCPACMQWCATTEAQLSTRMKNIAGAPEVQANPCPSCHGTDWMTSRELIKEETPRSRWAWLRPTPWGSAMLSLLLGCVGIACAVYYGTQGWTWFAIVNGIVGGLNLSGGIYMFNMIRMRALMDEQRDMVDTMMALNNALVANKVRMVMAHIRDDDAPIAPNKMH